MDDKSKKFRDKYKWPLEAMAYYRAEHPEIDEFEKELDSKKSLEGSSYELVKKIEEEWANGKEPGE